jgi:small conductance mechanosensitive channel
MALVDLDDFCRGRAVQTAFVITHLANPLTSADPVVLLVIEIIKALIVVVLTLILSHLARRRLRGGLLRAGFQLNIAILLARFLWLGVWAVGILVVLYYLGIGFTPLAAFVGVVGLAASLSLQQVLQNMVAGVYLLAERPFQIGDYVSVVGPAGVNHQGRVEDIQIRTTLLRSPDDELILVPNSSIFGGVVTNRSAVGGQVSHVTIAFPRETDPNAVRDQVLPLLHGLPAVLATPQPELRVDKVSKDDWTACLSFWAGTSNASSDVVWAIAHAFPQATVNNGDVTP